MAKILTKITKIMKISKIMSLFFKPNKEPLIFDESKKEWDTRQRIGKSIYIINNSPGIGLKVTTKTKKL